MNSPMGQALTIGRDVLHIDARESLPTAAAEWRGWFARIDGDGSTTNDELYWCRLTSAGTYEWRQIS